MIEENEIRAGNYFLVNYENAQALCSIEKPLQAPYFIVNIEDGKTRIAVQPNDLMPVELTPEWLKKFSFSPGEIVNLWTRKIGQIISVIRNTQGESGWTFEHPLPVKTHKILKSVHQLQNDYFLLYGNALEVI